MSGKADRPSAPGSRPGRDTLFFGNLLLIVATGVGACAWALAYTDWFPAIGGLLTLGGAFSWIAFVSGVLSDERKGQFQRILEERVLSSRATTVVVLVALVAALVAMSGSASVSVSSMQDSPALVTWYGQAGDENGDSLDIQPRAAQRLPVWVGFSRATRRVRLLVQGLPDLTLAVRRLERRSVTVPYSFLRPVLLVKPSARFIDSFVLEPGRLTVETAGGRHSIQDYGGRPVWIGGPGDLELPQSLRDAWNAEHIALSPDRVRRTWASPIGLGGPRIDLSVGQRVRVRFRGEDGKVKVDTAYTVRRVARLSDFPQVEVLDVR